MTRRAIQEGEIQRVGSEKSIQVNVRLLTATNRNLERAVEKGNFREDLFHRLNVYPLRVPALRERRTDIPLLAGFIQRVLDAKKGNWAAAARAFGMHRSNLHNLATRLKIRKKGNES